MTCATGAQAQLAIQDSATPTFPDTTASLLYEFLSESLTLNQEQIDVSGMSGSRERRAQTLVDGPEIIEGDIRMYLTAIDLDTWLPRILGGTKQADTPSAGLDTFDMAELLPEFGALIDRVASNGTRSTFAYKGCKVSRAVITGSVGQPVTMTVTIMGQTEDFHGEAFPSGQTYPTGANSQPYVFHEATVSYNSQLYQFNSFELIIDNLAEARHENSITAEEICATDLAVNLNMNVPWIDTFAPDYRAADVTGYLKFTKGAFSSTFTFGELVQRAQAPNVDGKTQIRWNLPLEARLSADGLTPQIRVVNDITT